MEFVHPVEVIQYSSEPLQPSAPENTVPF